MSALTRFMLAHKRPVACAWATATLAGLIGAGRVSDALDNSFAMPKSDAFTTNQRIENLFGGRGRTPVLVAVVHLPRGATVATAATRHDLRVLERRLERAYPGARVASYGSTGDRAFVSDDGRTTFALVYPPATGLGGQGRLELHAITAARRAIDASRVGGAPVEFTGVRMHEQASGDSGKGTGVLVARGT